MRERLARRISRNDITYGQLKEMMRAAYDAGAVNADRSVVNSSFTKGAVFNIFWPTIAKREDDELVTGYGSMKSAEHMLREFGQFWKGWKGWRPPAVPPKLELSAPYHEEPMDPRRKDDASHK
jgi:hypothetical protein